MVPFATTVSLFLHKQFNEHDLYCITTYCYVSSTRFRLRGIITKMNCELNKYKLHRIVNVMKLTEKCFFPTIPVNIHSAYNHIIKFMYWPLCLLLTKWNCNDLMMENFLWLYLKDINFWFAEFQLKWAPVGLLEWISIGQFIGVEKTFGLVNSIFDFKTFSWDSPRNTQE